MLKRVGSNLTGLEAWMERHGFWADPFGTLEADRERDVMDKFFVPLPAYTQIEGDNTALIFARRGAGKSAMRVNLANQKAPNNLKNEILAIEYTDFTRWLSKQRREKSPSIEPHIEAILLLGVEALVKTLCLAENRAQQLGLPAKIQLARFIKQVQPDLLSFEAFSAYWQTGEFVPNYSAWMEAKKERRLDDYLQTEMPATPHPILFLAQLSDLSPTNSQPPVSALRYFQAFVKLTQNCGFRAVYILVDRVDEYPETIETPSAQVAVLAPMLTHQPFLETPSAYFKFFLSEEAKKALLEQVPFRIDRIPQSQIVTLNWRIAQLEEMLSKKLRAYSDGNIPAFSSLCEGRHSKEIEDGLLANAGNSPRQLLQNANELCQLHVARTQGAEQIDLASWQAFQRKKELTDDSVVPDLVESAPLHPQARLIIDIRRRQISLDGKEKMVTGKPGAILFAMAQADGGFCSRDKLIAQVWAEEDAGGVSNQAVDRQISLLRKDLGDSGMLQNLVRTERGVGYRLLDYQLIG